MAEPNQCERLTIYFEEDHFAHTGADVVPRLAEKVPLRVFRNLLEV